MFHVIVRQTGPDDPALPLEQQTDWDEHASYMDSLVANGTDRPRGPAPERARGARDGGRVGG
jgi:hypothetical protein